MLISTSEPALTAEQRPVEGELLWQVLDICDALVHGPGEVVGMVKAAKDDAGEVDWLCEVAHQRPLNAHHIPPAERKHTHVRKPGTGATLAGDYGRNGLNYVDLEMHFHYETLTSNII